MTVLGGAEDVEEMVRLLRRREQLQQGRAPVKQPLWQLASGQAAPKPKCPDFPSRMVMK